MDIRFPVSRFEAVTSCVNARLVADEVDISKVFEQWFDRKEFHRCGGVAEVIDPGQT